MNREFIDFLISLGCSPMGNYKDERGRLFEVVEGQNGEMAFIPVDHVIHPSEEAYYSKQLGI